MARRNNGFIGGASNLSGETTQGLSTLASTQQGKLSEYFVNSLVVAGGGGAGNYGGGGGAGGVLTNIVSVNG